MKPDSFKLLAITDRASEEPDSAIVEPVTLAQAKKQLNVEHAVDDVYITDLITMAREYAENYTKRCYVEQTWQLGFRGWPCNRVLQLARPPVVEITTVSYLPSGSDDWVELDDDAFTFEPDILPGQIRIKNITGAPGLNCDVSNPVKVDIVCGTWPEFPARVRLAIQQMLTHWYENRTPVITGTIATEVPRSATALLDQLKLRKI